MISPFRKIALAVAFSPTSEALLKETVRLARSLKAEFVVIHVGIRSRTLEEKMEQMFRVCEVSSTEVKVRFEAGQPVQTILRVCLEERADLLVTGALKKENLFQYYVGSVARKILRKSRCSVLTMVDPLKQGTAIKNIVVNAEDSQYIRDALRTACQIGQGSKGCWVHVVRELKLYGLTMAASDQYTESEYDAVRQGLVRQEIDKVEELMSRIPHAGLKLNIKVVSGKSGFELPRFAERKHADLLVVGAPRQRFSLFDRLFPHDLEYILADLPCNLLIVHGRKEDGYG